MLPDSTPAGLNHACRFAPSPNGELHLGHAYSALINQRWAQRTGGRLLLRMENIDRDRCKPAYEAAILADLAWLGVVPAEPAMRQSERFSCYAHALRRLRDAELIYPCFCSRGDITRAVANDPGWPCDPDGSPRYPGTCRHLSEASRAVRLAAGEPAGWRLDCAVTMARLPGQLSWQEFGEGSDSHTIRATPELWGDVLLARKSMPTSYHLAVVIDDDAQGISDVIRGEDLKPATSLHRMLQVTLGLSEPRYHHHRLLLDEQNRKLSKSLHAPSLRVLREAGQSAAELRVRLGFPE